MINPFLALFADIGHGIGIHSGAGVYVPVNNASGENNTVGFINFAMGQTLTKHDDAPFGDFTYFVAADFTQIFGARRRYFADADARLPHAFGQQLVRPGRYSGAGDRRGGPILHGAIYAGFGQGVVKTTATSIFGVRMRILCTMLAGAASMVFCRFELTDEQSPPRTQPLNVLDKRDILGAIEHADHVIAELAMRVEHDQVGYAGDKTNSFLFCPKIDPDWLVGR